MIELQLFNNISDTNVVDKIISNKTVVNGDFRGAVDILKPTIGIIGNYYNFNYCYIPVLYRYYYIENITMERKNLTVIKCRVDVLKTYADDIKASMAVISKQRNYNPYFGSYEIESRTEQTKYVFNNPFNANGEYVMIAMRG